MKYKISPLNIFSIYLICRFVYYALTKSHLEDWDIPLFLFVLIPTVIFCIGIDFFLQSRIKIVWKVWAYETIMVVILAWLLGLI